jgi:hypothetical protein
VSAYQPCRCSAARIHVELGTALKLRLVWQALDETDGNLRQLEKEKMSLEARLSAAEAQVTTQGSQLEDLAEKLAALKLSLEQVRFPVTWFYPDAPVLTCQGRGVLLY